MQCGPGCACTCKMQAPLRSTDLKTLPHCHNEPMLYQDICKLLLI